MGKVIWLDGMMGVVVGDAIGNPVQFMDRERIAKRPAGPVIGMESGGVFNTPVGTWTDDSSMALATLSSILNKGKVDLHDIMMQFVKWVDEGEYTPFGKAFDMGNTCMRAIYNYKSKPDVGICGLREACDNGNGSLMRIMPACLYYYAMQKKNGMPIEEVMDGIHKISGLTHAHLRSKICCGMYYFMVKNILDGLGDADGSQNSNNLGMGTSEGSQKTEYSEQEAVDGFQKPGQSGFAGEKEQEEKPALKVLLHAGIREGMKYYGRDEESMRELEYLKRMFRWVTFKELPADEIRSSGYVIDSIEAAVWCLVTTDSFKECLLKAVNLGDDADTVGAIAGGLAGLYYGYENIPGEWLNVIKKREWIEKLSEQGKSDSAG